MQLRHAARTDTGKTRDHNEDSYGVETGSERAAVGSLFVVCDGIGGYASGEVASDLAVKTIISRFYGAQNQRPDVALGMAFEEANRIVFGEGGGKMGTTGVAAFLKDDVAIIANVGDCRAYLVRNNQIRQISKDHSFVREQIEAGILTEQQARESSYRNIITRALGNRADVEIDLFREPLIQDDVLVLCSDGLHGQVDPDEIMLAVTKVELDQACNGLIKLANERGGPDNITVVAIKVVELTFRSEADDGVGPSLASAKTERLASHGATTAAASQGSGTQQLTATSYSGVERRISADRRGSSADRRTARGTVAAPLAPAPTQSSPLRSFLLWMTALLLIGALIVGGYYFFLSGNGPAIVTPGGTASVPAAPPTQTQIGARTTPTIVPTGSTAPRRSPAATP